MNKELIKKLKGVGFKCEDRYLTLVLNGGFSFYYFKRTGNFFCYFDEKGIKGKKDKYPTATFTQITEAIKDITGVDLTKKTKREEIEELKVRFVKMEDAMKSQNEAIDKLKINEPLELVKEIAKLAVQLKRMDLPSDFEQGGVVAEVKGGETILSERHLKIKQSIKSTQGMCDKQAAEMQADEAKGFKVDDRVFIKLKHPGLAEHYSITTAAKEKQVCEITEINSRGFVVKVGFSDNNPNAFYWVFEAHELEHTPKESPKENDYTKAFLYACDLLRILDKKWFKGEVKPLDDLTGVLTQIDNIAAALVKPKVKALLYGTSYRLGIVSEAAKDQGYKEGDKVLYLGKGKGIGVARYIKEGHELRCTGKENLHLL